jgi:hypothetical protein
MELINSTRMEAGYSLGLEPSGRELLVVVVKGTFRIPAEQGAPVRLHEQQSPLVMADVFHGEPGLSAPLYEMDFAPRKKYCDVLLNASAYAPGGDPAERVVVSARIGAWRKSFGVVGDREWFARGALRATTPEPFAVMPISYDRAFGGTDQRHEDPAHHVAYLHNPSGRGFHKHLREEWVHGSLLPNTEAVDEPIARPDGDYAPMAFGPVGRHWEPRVRFAGTYDQKWVDEVAPLLPADFDARYYQSAPADQQIAKPAGEQEITLINLTRDGRRTFVLPHLEAPVSIFPKRGAHVSYSAHIDTILIEPDAERITLSWRIAHPLKRDLFEIEFALVGRKEQEWWQNQLEAAQPARAPELALETP